VKENQKQKKIFLLLNFTFFTAGNFFSRVIVTREPLSGFFFQHEHEEKNEREGGRVRRQHSDNIVCFESNKPS